MGVDGEQVGVMPIEEALLKAKESHMDLVEVSPNAQPPVCKIMDYGRYKYELTKKYQEARKKQKGFQVKEIKVRPGTDSHDLVNEGQAYSKIYRQQGQGEGYPGLQGARNHPWSAGKGGSGTGCPYDFGVFPGRTVSQV